MRFAPRWADLKVGPYVLSVALTAGSASAQTTTTTTTTDQTTQQPTTTQQPPPSGVLEPQTTSPLQGATPATPTAPPAPITTPVTPGTSVVAPPPLGRVFASDTGMIFNAIRPDKVMDFETVITKLRAALASSKDPVRMQQAKGWKIYKMAEAGPNNSVLYVFIMDPAVKGADYGIAKILSEAYPAEITDLYRMYTGAFATAGQTIVNLQPVTDKPAVPAGATPLAPGITTTPPTTTPPSTTRTPPSTSAAPIAPAATPPSR